MDQHFHTLIQTRHVQRRRDVVDDSLTSEVMEEMGDSMLEPPEVHWLILLIAWCLWVGISDLERMKFNYGISR